MEPRTTPGKQLPAGAVDQTAIELAERPLTPGAVVMTAAELAAHLRISPSQVHALVVAGKIPFFPVNIRGRLRRRFVLGDVLDALRQHSVQEVAS